jgi:hypothetical protein
MRYCVWATLLFLMISAGADGTEFQPLKLSLQPDDQSVYELPTPPGPEEMVNEGGVHISLDFRYMTDHVFRGIDYSEVGGTEDSPNLQTDLKIQWDLNRLPHPFIGVFVNAYDSDPVSQFQEIRPVVGFDWELRPITLSGGYTSFIYPEREDANTTEFWGKLQLDDSFLFNTEEPVFSPYVFAGYDAELNQGWYFEAGVSHDFVLEDWGIVLTALARVGYVRGYQQQFVFMNTDEDTGLQHYDVGLIGKYSLNPLLNISRRYGEFTLKGYLFYTDSIENDLNADTQLWGGVGIGFEY